MRLIYFDFTLCKTNKQNSNTPYSESLTLNIMNGLPPTAGHPENSEKAGTHGNKFVPV